MQKKRHRKAWLDGHSADGLINCRSCVPRWAHQLPKLRTAANTATKPWRSAPETVNVRSFDAASAAFLSISYPPFRLYRRRAVSLASTTTEPSDDAAVNGTVTHATALMAKARKRSFGATTRRSLHVPKRPSTLNFVVSYPRQKTTLRAAKRRYGFTPDFR